MELKDTLTRELYVNCRKLNNFNPVVDTIYKYFTSKGGHKMGITMFAFQLSNYIKFRYGMGLTEGFDKSFELVIILNKQGNPIGIL